MKLEFSRQIFEKYSNINFHEIFQWEQNYSIGRTDGRTDVRTDRQKDMTKLFVAFRNFSKARIAEGRRAFNELPIGITVAFF